MAGGTSGVGIGAVGPPDGRGTPDEERLPITGLAGARATRPASPRLWHAWRVLATDYISLTKPGSVALLLVTCLAGLFVASSGWPAPGLVAATAIGGALFAGAGNVLNCYLDRDIDGLMRRTRRRPLPSGRVTPVAALALAFVLASVPFAVFALWVNVLAGALAAFGALYYVIVYTVWLKRRTPHNVEIGGVAGAMPALVGWAAATGSLSLPAVLLSALVFFWTPTHFWSLALITGEDYASAHVPMLPVVAGPRATESRILIYAVAVVGTSMLIYAIGMAGFLYLGAAILLGTGLLAGAVRLVRLGTVRSARLLFVYANVYLALILGALVLDHITGQW